jgi:uncharacterized protein (DUF2147 family)
MKRLLTLAAFLLASSAAQAQYTFQYDGHTIHIDPDRGVISIPGVYDNSGRKSKRTRNNDHDTTQQQQVPQQANVEPQVPSAPPADATPAPQAVAPAAQPPAAPSAPGATATNPPASSATATVNNAPVDTAVLPPAPPPSPAPVEDATPKSASAPAVAAVPLLAGAPAPRLAPAAVRDPNSPVGVWLTEEKEGRIRIEQCGTNLCGYSVDARSNQNGEQILINMKPGKNVKWSGRIVDPNTGSTYDSTIALKGPDTLRVQGCAFGGMFCGGQTWTRAN